MKLVQPSFTGGEISPSLYARTDLERYASSLRTCRNFIVSSFGGVYNRPGTRYIAATNANQKVRLIPFQFNTTQTYVIELGANYARFYSNGFQVVDGGGNPVQITTPWAGADVWGLRFTQSADVMYLTHPNYPPQMIERTSASSFSITPYAPKEGPFLPVNPDQSALMASSGATGNVTLTSNSNAFAAGMVGQFVYLENANLSANKPWTAGEKNCPVGAFRVNAGNTYQCIQQSSGGSYVLCGGNAPQHNEGAEWDGPGDTRSDGTTNYSVGCLWQYIDAGYGIAQITGFTNANSVSAFVTKRMPAGVVGGAGSPAHTWNLTGDGTTVTFAIAGNVTNIPTNYSVTIGGVPVQWNPNYNPNPGGPAPVGSGGSGGYSGGRQTFIP